MRAIDDRTERVALLDRAYTVVVAVKGFDGVVELVLGVLLLTAPAFVQGVLVALAGEFGEGGAPWQTVVAGYLGTAAAAVDGTATGAVLFLVVHGVVKLVTVYCLLRRILRLYPWAIAVLAVLTVVQLQAAVVRPTIGAWTLAVLDLAVIALVVWEYRRLLRERTARSGRS